MANKIIVDGKTYSLDVWVTQVRYAEEKTMKLVTVSQHVKRTKENKGKIRIDYLDVPELDIVLVKL